MSDSPGFMAIAAGQETETLAVDVVDPNQNNMVLGAIATPEPEVDVEAEVAALMVGDLPQISLDQGVEYDTGVLYNDSIKALQTAGNAPNNSARLSMIRVLKAITPFDFFCRTSFPIPVLPEGKPRFVWTIPGPTNVHEYDIQGVVDADGYHNDIRGDLVKAQFWVNPAGQVRILATPDKDFYGKTMYLRVNYTKRA